MHTSCNLCMFQKFRRNHPSHQGLNADGETLLFNQIKLHPKAKGLIEGLTTHGREKLQDLSRN